MSPSQSQVLVSLSALVLLSAAPAPAAEGLAPAAKPPPASAPAEAAPAPAASSQPVPAPPPTTPPAQPAPAPPAAPAPPPPATPAPPSDAPPAAAQPSNQGDPASAPSAAASITPPAQVAPATAPPSAPQKNLPRFQTGRPSTQWRWDANVEGGIGGAFQGGSHLSGFGRVRAGLLYVNETSIASPAFAALGLTYDISDLSLATFGIQAEALSLSSGLWFQLGAMVDIQPRPAFMVGGGYSLIGAEAQLRWDRDTGAYFAIYGKLRIPIGIIGWAMSR